MSMAHPIAKDLADGEIVVLPCGMKTLFVAPGEDEATFDLEFSTDSKCSGIRVPFNWDFPQPLRSATATPAKVTAHGKVHLIYSL
jgi:hypothetical protein